MIILDFLVSRWTGNEWQEDESHSHLFFTCNWTSYPWWRIKSWLRINRRMMALTNAIRGLNSGRNKLEARMRRVSLRLTFYLIWEERSKRIFDDTCITMETIFQKFQVLFYIVFHFHEKDHNILNIGWSLWSWLVDSMGCSGLNACYKLDFPLHAWVVFSGHHWGLHIENIVI